MTRIDASQLKARCLAILDQVAETGEEVTILRDGKPIARLIPWLTDRARHPQDDLAGSVVFHDDCVEPALPADAWNANRGKIL